MKYLLPYFCICMVVLLSCNLNKHKKISTNNHKDTLTLYRNITNKDSTHFLKLIKKAKWWLYCFYCDRQVRFLPNTGIKDSSTTLGQLNLKYEYNQINNDTVLFYFDFYYDTLLYNSRMAIFGDLTGVKIILDNDSVIAFSNGTNNVWDGPYSRLGNPLQPEVIKYLRENKDKIDPWFYQEAKKRGVFDSQILKETDNR